MKKINFILAIIISVAATTVLIESCATSQDIANKSGAQLWGENCVRCHVSPTPTDFSDVQWKTIGLHMQVRANLTKEEAEKIFDFMKMSN